MFSPIKHNIEAHDEDAYTDFDFEGLLGKKHSKEGPAIAVADINQDGNDDVFIGGAFKQKGIIYLQNDQGALIPSGFETEAMFEDTTAAFADIDGDQDLDLVIGSGGNFAGARTGVRCYLNQGNGHFTRGHIIKPTSSNISVVTLADYDQDGDQDLFVGSLSEIRKYGQIPSSYLFQNDGTGKFKDVTASIAPALQTLGMVTDAVWEDINTDGHKDLIIVGEWMSPTLLINENNRFSSSANPFEALSGWYNAVEVVDLDQNGHMDLVLGNRGLNGVCDASTDRPMKLYVHDFDSNGTVEQIMTQTINGKDIPVHLKKELTAQINTLKKQNLKFSDYATKAIDELFPKDVLKQAKVLRVQSFESNIAYNKGNGQFDVKPLPMQAQWSSICAITTCDLNKDGHLDIILGGNEYDLKPQYSRWDASRGDVLISDNNGIYHHQQGTGFEVDGEVKAIKWLSNQKGNKYLFTAITNREPKVFEYHIDDLSEYVVTTNE